MVSHLWPIWTFSMLLPSRWVDLSGSLALEGGPLTRHASPLSKSTWGDETQTRTFWMATQLMRLTLSQLIRCRNISLRTTKTLLKSSTPSNSSATLSPKRPTMRLFHSSSKILSNKRQMIHLILSTTRLCFRSLVTTKKARRRFSSALMGLWLRFHQRSMSI